MSPDEERSPGNHEAFEQLERAQRAWAARWDRIINRLTQLAFLLIAVFVVAYFSWVWGLVEPMLFW